MKSILFLLTLTLTSTVWGQSFPAPLLAPVVGHRGYSQIAPENTMSSFVENVKIGAQGCEMDVYITKDGKIVCFHDETLKRLARDANGKPVKGAIADYDLETLRTFDFGVWKKPAFAGEKIPTLEETLDLLAKSNCAPIIEIKVENIEPQVIKAIRDRKLEKKTVIIAFSQNVVTKCRKLAPEICCAWLCYQKKKEPIADYTQRIIKTLKETGTNMVDMQYGPLTLDMFKKLTDEGVHVMVWTCDNPNDMKRLYNWGVKSITTNIPNVALEILKNK